MEKVKNFLKNYKWYVIGGVVLLIALLIAITLFVKNSKVNVEDDIEVEFSGYEKSGTAEITGKSYKKAMNKLYVRALKQSNFKNKEILNMIKNDNTHDIDKSNLNYTDLAGMSKAEKIMENVSLDIKNKENLSNGDKVQVQLKINKSSSKEYRLKAKEFTKEFKVHGLKKPQSLTAKDIIEDLNPKFVGVNGSGSLTLTTKDGDKKLSNIAISDYEFTVPNNGNLKNGDKIKLEIPEKLVKDINSSGSNTFEGKKDYTLEVKDLTDLNKVENLDQILDKNNTLIKDEYNSSDIIKYSTENIANYYKVNIGTESSSSFSKDDKEISEKVSPTTSTEPISITLVTATKVTEASEYVDTEVNYIYKGYKNYKLENNRLVKDDTTVKEDSSPKKDKMDELDTELKANGFKKL
ncbi:hypothetical protein FH144_01475 [Staphylococcus caledonicus]|uniref:hypothetical protein n=1 Tax=Staphylococcus sp. acrmy TaxID=2929076 RepID=UPI001F56A115|nr:hypothetical protein [Staphylococcus sp. acrmy]MCI2947099.1 hypothetical protein [Staphylococcus sp. acrmy]